MSDMGEPIPGATSPESIYKALTSDSDTVLKARILGREIPISKPVFLPERVKNFIADALIKQYKKALPGLDYGHFSPQA